eukprot:615588-Amphidinium_carterae.2
MPALSVVHSVSGSPNATDMYCCLNAAEKYSYKEHVVKVFQSELFGMASSQTHHVDQSCLIAVQLVFDVTGDLACQLRFRP